MEIAAGSYPAQTIDLDPSKRSTADVIFKPAGGGRVVLGCNDDGSNCLLVNGKHVTVVGVQTMDLPPIGGRPRQGGVAIGRGSDDVTFRNIDAGHFWIGGDNVRLIGGDYGPSVDDTPRITDDTGCGRACPPRNILIQGAFIHNQIMVNQHQECLSLDGGIGVSIRNNRFDTCSVFSIFSTPEAGAMLKNVLIENNFFSNSGKVGQPSPLMIGSHGGDCINILIRNNTFADGGDVISDCGETQGHAENIKWYGNIFSRQASCGPRRAAVVFDWNVVLHGVKCGPHDYIVRDGDPRFVNPAKLNFHLKAGSPALGRGAPSSFPRTDIDGQRRPRSGAPDAGADES